MRLNEIRPEESLGGLWDYSEPVDLSNVSIKDHREVCNAFDLRLSVNMQECATLNETTYKELAQLIDPNFLKQKLRADELQGPKLIGFEGSIMNFSVPSSKHTQNSINYVDSVAFDQWEDIGSDPDFDYAERARLLLWVGDIKVHCTCPSFLYWGYQYLCSVMDAAIYPEQRAPGKYPNEPKRRRNVDQRGIVCKHLNRVLRVLPFYSGSIAKELKAQFD